MTGRYLTPDPSHRLGESTLFLSRLLLESPQDLHDYVYVANSPANFFDPFGLARWKGYVTVHSGGEVFGGGVLIGAFESEVHEGKKATVVVVGVMGGVTAGVPVSVTTGEITLVTPGAPDPSDFFGAISYVSANAGLARTGGASYVEIGEAKAEDIFSFQYGFDAATSGYVGWSFVVGKQFYEAGDVKGDPCK